MKDGCVVVCLLRCGKVVPLFVRGVPIGVWVVFVRVGFCVGCGFVVSGCGVVDVGLGGCAFVHLRLWRLCGVCWVIVMVGECTGSDCGRMSSQKSLSGRSCCVM